MKVIKEIYSDLESFKNLEFHDGLNILLADKHPDSTEHHTRNRSGKTSLIDIIHFLTGSDLKKDASEADPIFKKPALINHQFGMEFDLGNSRLKIERCGANPGKYQIKTDPDGLTKPFQKSKEPDIISKEDYKKLLSEVVFGLEIEKDPPRFKPKFRQLFAYFVRKVNDGGMSVPTQQSKKQQLYDQQIAITFLLGLDWTIPQRLEIVRDKEKMLKQIKKAAGKGAFGEVIGTVAKLRTELAVAERKTERLRENIKDFKVLPEYQDVENETSDITQKLGKLSDDNVIDKELINDLKLSLESEKPPDYEDIERLYKEAKVIFPDNIRKRYEDLEKFHESVVENRHLYLKSEIEDANNRITKRGKLMIDLSQRYRNNMNLLKSHGALEQYNRLQSRLSTQEVQTENIRQRFITA